MNAAFPKAVTTTERVGRAMPTIAKRGFGKTVLENVDINAARRADAFLGTQGDAWDTQSDMCLALASIYQIPLTMRAIRVLK